MLNKLELKEFLIDNLVNIKEDPNNFDLEKMTKDFSEYIMIDYYD
jgi:hypothetical protein